MGGVALHIMLGGFLAWGVIWPYKSYSTSKMIVYTFPLHYMVKNLVLSFGVKMA